MGWRRREGRFQLQRRIARDGLVHRLLRRLLLTALSARRRRGPHVIDLASGLAPTRGRSTLPACRDRSRGTRLGGALECDGPSRCTGSHGRPGPGDIGDLPLLVASRREGGRRPRPLVEGRLPHQARGRLERRAPESDDLHSARLVVLGRGGRRGSEPTSASSALAAHWCRILVCVSERRAHGRPRGWSSETSRSTA